MTQKITILGVPMDLGQTRRGVDMGPSAIRYADVVEKLSDLGHKIEDLGNLEVAPQTALKSTKNDNLKNFDEVLHISRELADKVDKIVSDSKFPLIFGGDHSIAIGTIAGISKHYKNLGVIWFDAHADMNTLDTTPSGNIHGMPLAINLGHGNSDLVNILNYFPKIRPENVVIIGARSIDKGEKALIKQLGINVFTMHEIDRLGMSNVIDRTIDILFDCDGVHLSWDMDSLDPLYAPGVGTPVDGGITYREAHLTMELLYQSGIITSAEFVEINTILDQRNKTGRAAVELILSLFGEKVL
ncbi:MAG: arginase [Bacillales bacterium]|nr:arginase [Bacillales bacterium]